MILIGIAGLARSGKTTTAEYLASKFDTYLYSIAQPIKQACAAALNMDVCDFESLDRNALIPQLNLTPRQLMQRMGDTLISGNPSFLIEVLSNSIEADFPRAAIITDVRTFDEAGYIYSNNGFLIHLQRMNTQSDTPAHRTENNLKIRNCDYLVTNHSDKDELYEKLDLLADTLKFKFRDVA